MLTDMETEPCDSQLHPSTLSGTVTVHSKVHKYVDSTTFFFFFFVVGSHKTIGSSSMHQISTPKFFCDSHKTDQVITLTERICDSGSVLGL